MGAEERRHDITAFVQGTVRGSVARMREYATLVISSDDPEAVHQLRVSLRRLRSDLRTMQPLLVAGEAKRLRRALGAVDGIVKPVRELTVLHAALEARCDDVGAPIDVRQALHGDLPERIAASTAALRTYLASNEFSSVLAMLEALDVDALVRSELPLRRALARIDRAARTRLRAGARHARRSSPDQQLHAVRILAKRARYVAEAAAPVLGARGRRHAAEAEAIQTLLGEHQDSAMLTQHVYARAHHIPEHAELVGLLLAVEAGRRREIRLQWRALRRRLVAG